MSDAHEPADTRTIGIDPDGRRVVLHTVPLPPRLVLLYGFSRPYGRQARARWEPDVAAVGSARR